jgi:hypothetical protein
MLMDVCVAVPQVITGTSIFVLGAGLAEISLGLVGSFASFWQPTKNEPASIETMSRHSKAGFEFLILVFF